MSTSGGIFAFASMGGSSIFLRPLFEQERYIQGSQSILGVIKNLIKNTKITVSKLGHGDSGHAGHAGHAGAWTFWTRWGMDTLDTLDTLDMGTLDTLDTLDMGHRDRGQCCCALNSTHPLYYPKFSE